MPTFRALIPRPAAALAAFLACAASVAACGGGGRESGAGEGTRNPARPAGADTTAATRAPLRSDTVDIEGMPVPMRLKLFRTGGDFPLPFSAYVPADMAAEVSTENGGGASVHFYAEFGGHRNENAFLHLFVFPAGTPEPEAVAAARGYETGRGVPVSRGLEPASDSAAASSIPGAIAGYRFRYQDGGGAWFVGRIEVRRYDGRLFLLVHHYPAEYGDGFAPRAAVITDTWQWSGDGPLQPSPGRP